ncbi:hypothetical protein [Ruegeria arenilitoris]|uniref:hypothetical protein n=1 Tax=Ruegeria arenilitoris TaxID=1173585 RepID=UPI00147B7511|nr:hypothetical protein [Ruegeria arenilitoris]
MVKNLTQIGFWIVAGSVAWLSYRQARRTIFQPAKNEVFKVQIEKLQELMQLLNWKSDFDAWRASGLSTSADISMNSLFKTYAKDRFSAEVKPKAEDKASSVGMIVSPNATGFEKIVGPADDADESEKRPHHVYDWENYTWETFEVSSRYQEVVELLDEVSNNPVLPHEILSKVNNLQKELHDAAIRAAHDLEKVVREFPRHYPNRECLDGADLTWAHNMREERGQNLYIKLNELKQAIRTYLQTDELFGSRT